MYSARCSGLDRKRRLFLPTYTSLLLWSRCPLGIKLITHSFRAIIRLEDSKLSPCSCQGEGSTMWTLNTSKCVSYIFIRQTWEAWKVPIDAGCSQVLFSDLKHLFVPAKAKKPQQLIRRQGRRLIIHGKLHGMLSSSNLFLLKNSRN